MSSTLMKNGMRDSIAFVIFLTMIPYEDLTPEPIALPERMEGAGYVRPPMSDQTFVPEIFPGNDDS